MYIKFFKRLLDFICSLILILLLWPFLLVVAIIVKCKLGSPILFKQKRPGKNEKRFTIYKFRSMTEEKDENGNLLPDELRLNNFGRVFRSTSLDELPQLINILKGDMSFVGPRPLLEEFLPLYTEAQRHRHDVTPGLTGLAQANGRNGMSWDDRLKYDLEYIKNINFIDDLKILLKTVVVVLKRDGASSVIPKPEQEQAELELEKEKE